MSEALNRKLKDLDALTRSRGWALLNEVMQEELIRAAMKIAEHPEMTEKEVDFRRGAIWAAKQLLDLPERLKQSLQMDLAVELSKKADDPPRRRGA